MLPTSTPLIVTIPLITFDRPTPTVLPPPPPPPSTTSQGLFLTDLPIPNVPHSLPEPFEAPHLIVPIDRANPTKVIGNGYTAQLSPIISTVFVYDVSPAHQGNTCTLVFLMPPAFEYSEFAPVKTRAPGGISVSRLNNQVSAEVSASNVGDSSPVGGVALIQPGYQYNIASAPCEAGQSVGYQVDSLYGLDMDWFQMTNPPLGLFMLVS